MGFPSDYHMHTPLCRHAVGEPAEYARHALTIGLKEIGFSDHSPMPRDDFDDWRMRMDQLDLYVQQVREAAAQHPSLQVKLALEVDYLPGQEDWIRKLTAAHPWDYLIGSVHYVSDSWDVDNPQKISLWKQRDPFEVWSIYFDRLTQAASSGLFDIIGHADLPKKFNFRPTQDCSPLFRNFLAKASEHDVCIELNTAGLRKDCREIYPSSAFLELAAQYAVPITFGSDAHAPGDVGMDFDKAVALARSKGYSQTAVFSARKRTMIPF